MYKSEESKLQELVEIIKVPRTDQAEVLTLGALIVLDVHSTDVTKGLAVSGISSTADFEWISQLRYYVQPEKVVKGKTELLDILVKMVNSVRQYGFEYQGN